MYMYIYTTGTHHFQLLLLMVQVNGNCSTPTNLFQPYIKFSSFTADFLESVCTR